MPVDEEVVDNYLLWELCKQRGLQELIADGSSDGDKLKEDIIEKVRIGYQQEDYDLSEKIEKLKELDSNPEHRVKMFEYCSWEKETVKVEDLGTTLPRAMNLPPEVISGSLPEVIQFVKEAGPNEYRHVGYIRKLAEVPEVLDEFHPWVIHPGSIIRRRDRMDKLHGDKNWNIKDVWGAIHDGNHRAIAKILANDLEEIECYVGRPSNDKIYDHVEL